MIVDLITRREQAMDRADRALDAAWPERKGENYVSEMQAAAKDLEHIVDEMKQQGIQNVEQSRAYRYLGSIYSDLAPALGDKMFQKAKDMYMKSEALLKGYPDDLEHAKLNFNYGNTLRQMDPNNVEQLQESQRRFQFAKKIFAAQAPQFLKQVEDALSSVENLLNVAPMLGKVEQNLSEMSALQEDLEKGGDVKEIMQKTQELMSRDGGVYNFIPKLQILMEKLPPELKESEKYAEINRQIGAVTGMILGGGSMDQEEAEIMKLLTERLNTELKDGKVNKDRAETLHGLLEQLKKTLGK